MGMWKMRQYPKKMKVLHVMDCVGVGAVLSKYLGKLGVDAQVVIRYIDNFGSMNGIDRFYGTKILRCRARRFYVAIVKMMRNYDIIHIHGFDRWMIILEIIGRFFFRKKIVLHSHNKLTDEGILRRILSFFAHIVLVSSPDLLHLFSEAVWIPNPVDIEHFYPVYNPSNRYGCFLNRTEKQKGFVEPNGRYGKRLWYAKYADLPDYLRQFTMFKQLEWKVEALSKLSLESLACGLTVLWNGLEIKGKLPERHEPLNVAKKTLKIYQSLWD